MTEEEKMRLVNAEVIARYDAIFPKPLNPKDHILWRYLSAEPFDKVSWFFQQSKIWLTKASDFKDKLEGTLPEKSKEHWKQFESQFSGSYDAEKLEKIFAEQKEDKFVASWTWDEFESIWMWKEYCGKQTGILVKTTFDKAVNECRVDGIDTYQIGRVTYVMDRDSFQVPISNTFFSIMHKDGSLKKEKEVRIVALGNPTDDHMEMPVNLVDFVDEIRVHPMADQEYFDSVVKLAAASDPRLAERVVWSWLRGYVTEADFQDEVPA